MKKVLVGVEAADNADVVEAAVKQAQGADGNHEVVVAYVEPLLDARVVFDPRSIREAADPIRELEKIFPALQGRIRRLAGEPIATICRAATAESADLIILGSSIGRRRLRRSQSSRIAKYAPCPVTVLDWRRVG